VVPILAHIDRYPKLIKSSALLDEFIDMGCLMQMNLESLQEGFLKKRKLLKYIQSNMVHVVGTDAHNMSERPPVYSEGISVIAKALGEGAVNQLTRNALQIISES
jgi:protein-tyrosine phosphatase